MALLASCAARHTSLLRRPAVSAPPAARLALPRPLLLQRPVVRRQQSTTKSAASSSTTPPERPPAALAVAPCTGLVSLAFGESGYGARSSATVFGVHLPGNLLLAAAPKAQPLQVDCALLWHASPVLRRQIEKICGSASPGAAAREGGGAAARVLLVDGTAADWGAVLKLVKHTGDVSAVCWDNVASLLRLADKYDMAAVRSTCAAFLVGRKNDMSLHEPLESPKNLLHAASLVERYLSSRSTPLQAALQEHATPIASLLQHTLQAVHICHWTHTSDAQAWNTWKSHARGVVTGLNKSVRHRRYGDIVTVAVQVQVQKAAMAALEVLTS